MSRVCCPISGLMMEDTLGMLRWSETREDVNDVNGPRIVNTRHRTLEDYYHI